ncbi:MAG: hypothetical protein PUP93_22075 [Rhizonema sp. NSF051]|nr:hypothetical protein [Rhizonema sp. NSF051]
MYYRMMTGDSGMMIVVYPDNQRITHDIFLLCPKFKNALDLIGTHATTSEYGWQTKEQSQIVEFKVPQKIVDVQVIDRNEDTESYFVEFLETNKDYLPGTHIQRIVNVYCVFDEAIANLPRVELIVDERIAQNDFQQSAA